MSITLNEVYIVYSAELDVRNCILGVFSNIEAAQDFEDHCYAEGIGSILIRESTVNDKFIQEDE
jgi:hypothetical protein